MKARLLLFFFLLSFMSMQAQEFLFDRTIPERDLPAQAKLPAEMRSHYHSSRYARQDDFMKPVDFFIMISQDLIVKSKFRKMQQYPTGSSSYIGQLEGNIHGEVSFSKYNDRIAGMIVLEDGRKYIIDQTSNGLFAISLSNEASYISKESKGDDYIMAGDGAATTSNASRSVTGAALLSSPNICAEANTCAGPSVIDLMIVYTQQAETAWGGTNNTVANITQAVTNMNTSMTNTGVSNVTFRLVHTQKVNYTESGNFSTDLSRLGGTSDGYIDDIHSLRDAYGADMVSMIIGSPTSSCGIGYLNTSTTTYNPGNAFNVSLYSCVVGNFTMAHEFGHNMGLRHDWYVDASTSPCAHHHGYVNDKVVQLGTASTSSQRWRTIMAYNNQCADLGFNCTRVNMWSNPSRTYNGDPQGAAIGTAKPSDEAYAFNRMACLVASFRDAAPSCLAPTGLSSSNITQTTATVSWSSVTGANSYDVDYKTASSTTWTNLATATTSLSAGLSNLQINTLYDWRVRTNCAGSSSAYTTAQFTTPAACGNVTGLSTTNITTTSASLNWSTVPNALSYTVEYKLASASTWTVFAAATTQLSAGLTGLQAGTAYNWRVLANCVEGAGNYSTANFTTTALPVCNDVYETNNTTKQAKAISLNTEISAAIGTAGDLDYFRFTTPNSTATNVRVSLYGLPADYNAFLYTNNNLTTPVASGTNTGTTSETLVFNTTAKRTTYYILIRGVNNSTFTNTSCYKLKAENSVTPYDQAFDTRTAPGFETIESGNKWKVFPVPVKDQMTVWVNSNEYTKTSVHVYDLTGRTILSRNVDVRSGINTFNMDVSTLKAGVYLVKMKLKDELMVQKIVVE